MGKINQAGVTGIKMKLQLTFDDGVVIVLSTPDISKDIRDGNFFPDEQIAQAVMEMAEQLARYVEETTSLKMHNEQRTNKHDAERPYYWRKPDRDNPFTSN